MKPTVRSRTAQSSVLYLLSSTLLITIIAVAVISCSSQTASKDTAAPTKGGRGAAGGAGRGAAVAIQATTPQRISIQRQVDFAGSLMSPDQARISSEVAGVVKEVFAEVGQEVQPGHVVAQLNTTELELALRRAQSQLRQTEAQLGIDGTKVKDPLPDEQISSIRTAMANRDDAQAQLRRAQRLRSQNLLPQADLDTAETRVKVTEANLQAAIESVQSLKATLQDRREAVTLAQKKLNDASIRASVGGQISERLVQVGEFIRENTPVVTVVKVNPIKIKSAVQERYAGLIKIGLLVEFTVESFPNQTFRGRVATISPSVDSATRTFPVEIFVDNSDRRLKPGFFAKGVILTNRDENVVALTEDAISTLAGVSSVYVIEGGKVRQQPVTLGTQMKDLTEITGGLKGDETLASSNLTMLATGVQVKVSGMAEGGASSRPLETGRGKLADQEGGRP